MDFGDDQLTLLASWIDEAAQARTGFAAHRSLNDRIPIAEHQGVLDEENSEAAARKATAWAFAYHVQVVEIGGKWRCQIIPYLETPDGSSTPPRISEVPDSGITVWSRLSEKVSSNFGKARLHHLLFERKHGNVRDHATQAAQSYFEASQEWTEWLDKEEALNTALRLARAVGHKDLASQVMTEMLNLVNQAIAGEKEVPGVALRLLRPLTGENSPPQDLNVAVDAAIEAYDSPFIRDELIFLKLRRAATPEEREVLHAQRVQIWLDAADGETGLRRAGHLKTALQRAQDSGQASLIERSAAALQKIRTEDLGLVSFSASGAISREQFQEMMAPVVNAADWREALLQFAFAYGPAVGTFEHTKKAAEEYARISIIGDLATTELLGSDGLPRFSPKTDAEKNEMRLARQEAFTLQSTAPLLAHLLHKVAEVHKVPSEADLTEFFSEGPLTSHELAASISRCFIRFWTGDPEGATFTIAPKIEAMARNLVLSLDAGVYRLQRQEKPGQYPGLASLLATLRERGLDESWYRNILTICGNPAGGWNLRNELAHGFIDNSGSPGAAILFQCVMYLWTLGPKQESEDTESDVPHSSDEPSSPSSPTEEDLSRNSE
ncbi:DUF4209 domain-containing protein [Streptomyces sp. NPDC013978]|uniref:DUF4209 domain-containing protein n=1 Tax=Streptomyces sp. NPDC013978 TaxID=3364869 RepID=UPI0036FEB0D2